MESSEIQGDIEKYLFGMVKYKISEIKNLFLKTMLNICYIWILCSSNSPFGLVTEIENFPVNMKVYVELFRGKKRLDWKIGCTKWDQ